MADYSFTWRGPLVLSAKDAAQEDVMSKLAQDIERYLVANLHRYPLHQVHRLAAESFAEVGYDGDNIEVVFGSDAPYTALHEMFATSYEPHPQIQQTGDLFGHQLGPRVVAAFRARVR